MLQALLHCPCPVPCQQLQKNTLHPLSFLHRTHTPLHTQNHAWLTARHALSPPACVQVWDYSRSADARDTEGGASKRSLMEQVAKMRTYLSHETANVGIS